MTLTSPRQQRLFRETVAIVLLGLALGFTVNYRLLLPALGIAKEPPGVILPRLAATAPLPTPIEVAEVQRLLRAGTLLIDARSTLSYAEGHLPGALSLPREEVNAGRRSLPPWPKEKTIIVYCGGYGCDDSFALALLLSSAGYENLRVFEGGYPQWVEARLPIEKGAP